jgi:hypothetical protein
MFKVIFSDICEPLIRAAGIAHGTVTDAIEHHDRMSELRDPSGQIAVSYYVKYISDANYPYYLLSVVGHPPDGRIVVGAYKVFDDIAEGVDSMSPLNLYRKLADRFGIEFTMEGVKAKYFRDIEVFDDRPPYLGQTPPGLPDGARGMIYSIWIQRHPKLTEVYGAIFLNETEYLKSIDVHEKIKPHAPN